MDDPTEISKQAEMRHGILSEQGTLKYNFMTSLQKIAMARIGSILWMDQEIQQEIVNLCKHCYTVDWVRFHTVEKRIVAKVSHLLLPNSVCQKLKCLIPVLGNLIFNWISYHDKHILNPNQFGYSAVDLIRNITWTVRGKIDYLQTAKNILGNIDGPLNDDHKFKLACTYCLEDEIVFLSSRLIKTNYLSSVMIDQHPMVYFWTAHITVDSTPLNNLPYYSDRNQRYDNMNINNHIIQLLVKDEKTINDVPIKFMWKKLSNEEKYQNIAFLFKKVKNSEFILSLLSNLDYDRQQNIIKQCSKEVLCAIVREYWWWGKYFLPTALNVLDMMDPESFWQVLLEINERKRRSSEKNMYDCYKSLFKCLWQAGSMQLKEYTFHATLSPLEFFITRELNWERDMDVIEIILQDLTAQQKLSIAFCVDGIQTCIYFIKLGRWNTLDLFIKSFLSSKKDISLMKQLVMQEKEIIIYFSACKEFHEMERFMNWAY